MKRAPLLFIAAILFAQLTRAQQNIGISNDGLPPNNSAMLDVRNPNKGNYRIIAKQGLLITEL
jgi:hypothetical protein